MTRGARNRIGLAAIGLAFVFSVFSGRLVYIQIAKHEEYAELAARKNSIRQVIHARRGNIVDRNGEILAASVPTRTVVADGSHIIDPEGLARVAAPFLGIPERELDKRLRTDRKYVVIRRGLPEEDAIALRRAMEEERVRGLYFEETSARIYPNREMLCHVLGFLNHEAVGVQGVEMTMQNYLQGENGFRHIERDPAGREIVVYRGLEHPPRHGHNVELTIDMGLQAILEDELDNAFRELEPRSIIGVLVKPQTGEILAMANRPHFDPAQPGEGEEDHKRNRAILDMVEPGSTFKIVPIAGALNEGVASIDTKIFCENGRFHYGGRTLRDHRGYGMLSVHDVMVKSSNIGSAKLAMLMGDHTFYEYVRRFGFGERTGVELPGEIPGLVHPPHRWSRISITRIPMGHEIAVTGLQMVMAMGAIANGGNLMAPQIVRAVHDEDGRPLYQMRPEVVREAVSPEAAELTNRALMDVVSPIGTASLAKVEGFRVAGKTGTAQRVDPNGGYTPGKYVVSFLGYMPAENPEFVGLVLVDDAQAVRGANYGGLVAAPIFSRVAERAAAYLDLDPLPPGVDGPGAVAGMGGLQ